ncbi:hypothetical protein VRU48_14875 [Pedobacter sp. KR3-3]|uniref:Uncharacterized protein n=1 Tax=Pedobacter albus TaxID=3113905 RepID=A0ABU7IAA3_9SPHI|nr:hypothetical protein [Pedobacter sp. KR3-3]MEE1946405.1 hypothetical protein [Pedobacter sp. KR3-3]
MKEQLYKRAIDDFSTMMYQKGYRGRFSLDKGDRINFGTLAECLETYVRTLLSEGIPAPLKLETYAAYKHAGDHILCTLHGNLDTVKGFIMEQMDVIHQPSGKGQSFRLVNNRQIPGINAVLGLFPKPKPWDHLIKGKFRP